ncbi:MAG TPA: purine-nucleoside phosphorylase [Chitinophagaceae bacterium]|nr:purine-nucleoside phosphorylase [Chitinophagaceae bacterium]
MSIHIAAKNGEIAKTVLLPGDPLRAKHFAEQYLEKPRLVSQTRNIYFFTGTYQGIPLTIGASGMGCPSIGIYSYELYTEFEVDCIIRVGTCGAYTTDLKLYDLVNVDTACSESTYAKFAFGIDGQSLLHQGRAFTAINETAMAMGTAVKSCAIHSSDIFYRKEKDIPAIALANNCLAVEMEAFALFANAQYLDKTAATLLTVSDIIPTHERISADQREKSLQPMVKLALEAMKKF